MYGDADRAIFELGLRDPVPILPGFDAVFLDGMRLQELAERLLTVLVSGESSWSWTHAARTACSSRISVLISTM
jgi:hypothetical protein